MKNSKIRKSPVNTNHFAIFFVWLISWAGGLSQWKPIVKQVKCGGSSYFRTSQMYFSMFRSLNQPWLSPSLTQSTSQPCSNTWTTTGPTAAAGVDVIRCASKDMALTRFGHSHILTDSKQRLALQRMHLRFQKVSFLFLIFFKFLV